VRKLAVLSLRSERSQENREKPGLHLGQVSLSGSPS
jgi:hypothetical protein